MNEYAKLEWRCRRGMRELDLLLGRFLKSQYNSLTDVDRDLFTQFLEEPNEKIMACLLGNVIPDNRYTDLIERIRIHGVVAST